MLGTRARPCEIESSDQQDAPFLVSESSFLLSLRSANGVAIGDTDDSGVSTMLLLLLCGYSVTRGREGSGRDYERATSLSGVAVLRETDEQEEKRSPLEHRWPFVASDGPLQDIADLRLGLRAALGARGGGCGLDWGLPHNHSYLAS